MIIVEVIEELGIDHREGGHRHVSHGWVGLDCPRCSPGSGKYKLGVPLDSRGAANCWTCGYIPLVTALAEITGRPYAELRRLLGDVEHKAAARLRVYGKFKPPKYLTKLQGMHRNYLKRRGFDPCELERLWHLGGIGIAPTLGWRIWVPVHQGGVAVSWTTRSIINVGRRWVGARPDDEEVPIKQTLYGEDYARHAAVVVEGPTDAWRVGPGAVATYGTAFTKAQVARLSRFPVRVVAYDSEPSAQAAAKRLCRELAAFPGQTHRIELDAADPGVATKREVRELRKKFLD